ncbi:Fpg/Nei family DNA glycosylase [Nesterenkonia sp. YGD6]|uniref:Fpg/Nei family DNA glycosylase n=1 Tax=Nesterenkonia sp. YGD6 TaxID=2901231 RepID=UPI001F4CC4F8|nr:Fpg/Nei family DNA glycosylase [Nesterenkonia sp. YGD6]MCH8561621.1 Fpg/Nei family DNA glycosylase [Nesterenkonia sp. YGD6]
MPELPEVEVVRRGISRWATGRTVETVTIHDPRSLRRHARGTTLAEPARLDSFAAALTQQTLLAPQRRGKFLWIPLQGPAAPAEPASGSEPVQQSLLIHLGMSGQVLIDDPSAPAQKHLKITLQLGGECTDLSGSSDEGSGDEGSRGGDPSSEARGEDSRPKQLRFIDQRIFGGMQISELVASTHPSGSVPVAAVHIAPDPLEPGFDEETFFRTLRRRRTGLKRALLDQGMVSGIGNIYADEALWLARLHYLRPTETITRAEAARLLDGVKTVMLAALEAGGTSFDALYVNVNGASGYFDRSLQSYGRTGQPCRRCADTPRAATIRRDPFMGRSSFWCPTCQPRPRRARA